MLQKLSYAAVVIGALRVNIVALLRYDIDVDDFLGFKLIY